MCAWTSRCAPLLTAVPKVILVRAQPMRHGTRNPQKLQSFEHLTFQTKLYLQHQRMQQVKLQLEHKPYTKRYLEQNIGCAYTVKEQPLRSIWGLGTLFF